MMQSVRYDGDVYVLVKESAESSLVRNPDTGEETYVPNDELEALDSPALETRAAAVPESVRVVLRVAHDDRSLGLLLDLHENGPRPVRDMLTDYSFCESDLLGLLTECRAAGVVEEVTAAGEPGYALTSTGDRGVAKLLNLR